MKSKLTNRLVLCLVVMGFQNDPFVNLRPLESLEPWGANYRRGDVEAIKSSIKKFGFNSALRVKGSVVMAGNHAFKALKQLQSESFIPKGVEIQSGEWFVPVIDLSHLSDEEARAFAIADNRTQELGSVDDEQLAELLMELRGTELEHSTGYSDDDLESLLISLRENTGGSDVENDPESEWVGMPEFEQKDDHAFKSVTFHFADADALSSFETLIGRKLTNRYCWWPQQEIAVVRDQRYVSEVKQ